MKDDSVRFQAKLEWIKIYEEYFHVKKDFVSVFIPVSYDPDKHFVIIVAKGLTLNQAMSAMREKFAVDSLARDLDASVTKNDRIADRDYCILVRKNVEADENLRKISAQALAGMSDFKVITLLERFLLEIYYFKKTEKHLDVANTTLCSGSSDSKGNTPGVRYDHINDSVNIVWYRSRFSIGYLRPRKVLFAA